MAAPPASGPEVEVLDIESGVTLAWAVLSSKTSLAALRHEMVTSGVFRSDFAFVSPNRKPIPRGLEGSVRLSQFPSPKIAVRHRAEDRSGPATASTPPPISVRTRSSGASQSASSGRSLPASRELSPLARMARNSLLGAMRPGSYLSVAHTRGITTPGSAPAQLATSTFWGQRPGPQGEAARPMTSFERDWPLSWSGDLAESPRSGRAPLSPLGGELGEGGLHSKARAFLSRSSTASVRMAAATTPRGSRPPRLPRWHAQNRSAEILARIEHRLSALGQTNAPRIEARYAAGPTASGDGEVLYSAAAAAAGAEQDGGPHRVLAGDGGDDDEWEDGEESEAEGHGSALMVTSGSEEGVGHAAAYHDGGAMDALRESASVRSTVKAADSVVFGKDRIVRQFSLRVSAESSYRVALVTLAADLRRSVLCITVMDPTSSRIHKRDIPGARLDALLTEAQRVAVRAAASAGDRGDAWLARLGAAGESLRVTAYGDGAAAILMGDECREQ